MSKRYKIRLPGVLLLLLYLGSLFPYTLFHHHESEQISYEQAGFCQRFVYFGKQADDCSHHSHVSKKTEKCSLCDEHVASAHLLPETFLFTYYPLYQQVQVPVDFTLYSLPLFLHSGRGPPSA